MGHLKIMQESRHNAQKAHKALQSNASKNKMALITGITVA